MTSLSCPVCGLEQTLEAPDCARCGAPMDGSGLDILQQTMTMTTDETPTALFEAGEVDERTTLRATVPDADASGSAGQGAASESASAGDRATGSACAAFRPGWTTPAPPPVPTGSGWQALWHRLTGKKD
ncbi:hypothetical protein [Micropruina sonneratiae]|uniref:hypothetical protein n=1 Tax=Micropruina sonneratiae TaxID=2986940 RepID=UPI002225B840|nr:hypothetical protein [Micropruina sp. KQZ13P-5]MCW3158457.1 hypothetical protein [Micropruina sp. KQZ13P-5]